MEPKTIEYLFEVNDETDLVSTNDYPDPNPSIPVSAEEFAQNTGGTTEPIGVTGKVNIVYTIPPAFSELKGFPIDGDEYFIYRTQRGQ